MIGISRSVADTLYFIIKLLVLITSKDIHNTLSKCFIHFASLAGNKETRYAFSLVPRLSPHPAQMESWVCPGNEANIAWIQLCLYEVWIRPNSQLWFIALCQQQEDSHAVLIMWLAYVDLPNIFFSIVLFHHLGFDRLKYVKTEWEFITTVMSVST